jgi:uncharacterized membrane protein YagU involved in acid resistance
MILRAILLGGLAAGVLDLLDALVFSYLRSGAMPTRILQAIASGLIGREAAVGGGAATAALGFVIHFCVATTMAACFVLLSRWWTIFTRRPVMMGILYGVGAYFFMNHVVLPLSAIRGGGSAPWPSFINGVLIHAFGVGLPIALITRAVLGEGRSTP